MFSAKIIFYLSFLVHVHRTSKNGDSISLFEHFSSYGWCRTKADIQLGSHQWIQGYLGKAFCWFSREVLEFQTNPIPILHPHSKSFHMSISDFCFDQVRSWHKTNHDFEAFIWTIGKIFDFKKFRFFFPIEDLHLGTCFEP